MFLGHISESNAASFRQGMSRVARQRKDKKPKTLFNDFTACWLVITLTNTKVNLFVAQTGKGLIPHPISVLKNINITLASPQKRDSNTAQIRNAIFEGLSTLYGENYDVSTLMKKGLGIQLPSVQGVIINLPPALSKVRAHSKIFNANAKKLNQSHIQAFHTQISKECETTEYQYLDQDNVTYQLDGKEHDSIAPTKRRCRSLEISSTVLLGRRDIITSIKEVLKGRFPLEQIHWKSASSGFSMSTVCNKKQGNDYILLDITEDSMLLHLFNKHKKIAQKQYNFGYNRYEQANEEDPLNFDSLFEDISQLKKSTHSVGIPLIVIGQNDAINNTIIRTAAQKQMIAASWASPLPYHNEHVPGRALCSLLEQIEKADEGIAAGQEPEAEERSHSTLNTFVQIVCTLAISTLTVLIRPRIQ